MTAADGEPTDTERLDWATNHPEEFWRVASNWWATAGAGFREHRFNWRGLIDGAMLAERAK